MEEKYIIETRNKLITPTHSDMRLAIIVDLLLDIRELLIKNKEK
jgi:hypothetical protein